ncbi:MAG: hypothetical protein IIA67_08970 [Planctomycetes bacterium]|nr:hypothetical protein [Planctomycetota bacterium]
MRSLIGSIAGCFGDEPPLATASCYEGAGFTRSRRRKPLLFRLRQADFELTSSRK